MNLVHSALPFDRAIMARFPGPFAPFLMWSLSEAPTMPKWRLQRKKIAIERLWRDLFSDPLNWWDHRSQKTNPRYPDFKHKHTRESLWLGDNRNPPWVESEMAMIAPGTLELNVFSWTQRLSMYNKARQYEKTLELFKQMQGEGVTANQYIFAHVLNACAALRDLEEGKRIHRQIVEAGYESHSYVGSSLVDMYAKCGSIEGAWKVFIKMPTPDVVGWSAMIQGYVKCGQGEKALNLFQEMQRAGVDANSVTFLGLLKACASQRALEEGRFVHEQIKRSGCESDIFVGSSLVDMYAKCGSMEDAWRVFSRMPVRNVVGWTALILGYVKCGHGQKALDLYRQMEQDGVVADSVTFVGLLKSCAILGELEEGKYIHQKIRSSGCESDIYIGTSLVDMYAKCGSIEDAWKVFSNMPKRNVVSWTAMILGYVKSGQGRKAIELSRQMQLESVVPDSVTFVGLLSACASLGDLEEGRAVHEQIISSGCESENFVSTSLVDMYAKCGSIEDAWSVFCKMPTCDVAGWNAMILGYVTCGQAKKALILFEQMQQSGVDANSVTFIGLLNACASLAALEEGRCVHKQVIISGCESDVFVGSSLVDMYAKCGSMEDAWNTLMQMPSRNVVCWTAMILGYVKCGQGQQALEISKQMEEEGLDANSVTYVGLLNACASMGALEEGRRLHKEIILSGCESDIFVGCSLVDMYAKCGSIDDARRVFNQMPTRNVVAWNAMILGYVKCGQGHKALKLSRQMQMDRVIADAATFVGLLNACASLAALEEGRVLHQQIVQCGCESDIFVANSLVDMYAKCGSIEDALKLFNNMPLRNVVSWNIMIGGYAMHGHAKEALGLFEQMSVETVKPDEVTFVCLLSACSHGGLVEEGLHYFEFMGLNHGISPSVNHYAIMVDLLGRADRLSDAEGLVKTMSVKPNISVWISLLGACRIHGNVEMGERAAKEVLELDPGNSAAYVLLSNIYAAAGLWDARAKVHNERLDSGVTKEPGQSWIEVDNEVHSFVVDDREHPKMVDIWVELKRLSEHMKEAGYIPDNSFALFNDADERRSFHLCRHSEKLAIAFGLISTPAGATLRIVKNLRVCGDCHSATKFIAKLVGRTIIVRDSNRFHHFQNGLCSCRDYW